MRILLDENIAAGVEPALNSIGIDADHIDTLGLKAADDSSIFEFAIREGYDAIVTKDGYQDVRDAVIRAMQRGLRVFHLKFGRRGAWRDSTEAQIQLLFAHREFLERATAAGSDIREATIHAALGEIRDVRGLADLGAGLERPGG